jgi:hypothetical protein
MSQKGKQIKIAVMDLTVIIALLNNVTTMREIKFRAWDKEQKIIGYFGLENFESETGEIEYTNKDGFFESANTLNNLEVMQYTGLKDKNGVEIYEGDICNDGSVVTFLGGRFLLLYEDNTQSTKKAIYEDLIGSLSDEVIGNIYQNPKLIK